MWLNVELSEHTLQRGTPRPYSAGPGGGAWWGCDELATDYEGPDQERVPGLMSELVHWLDEGDPGSHVLLRAAMAHLNLVKIHPWSDGNGRMSRSLQTLLIARGGLLAPEFSSIEEWLGMPGNTWDYYKVLREVGGPVWSPERDTLPWIRFNLLAYHQQTQRVQRRVDRSHECWVQLLEETGAHGVTERQVTALHEVAMAGRVRRSRYERHSPSARNVALAAPCSGYARPMTSVPCRTWWRSS